MTALSADGLQWQFWVPPKASGSNTISTQSLSDLGVGEFSLCCRGGPNSGGVRAIDVTKGERGLRSADDTRSAWRGPGLTRPRLAPSTFVYHPSKQLPPSCGTCS